MKVKLLVSRADAVRAYNVGDVVSVSDAEAVRMIEAGQAIPDDAPAKRETATKKKTAEKR